ncbi:wbnG protein [Eggerthella sp. CAG:368]|nr:wbnG protein [Eggerthella sp. CAG:368]
MKLGIMQPYFVPYIGYWQLLAAVDKYVVYDDVNYIKGGWINRNRTLVNGKPAYFNLPIIGASSNKLINEISVNIDSRAIGKCLRGLEASYRKAPYYKDVYPVFEKILTFQEDNLARFLLNSFVVVMDYLSVNTELIMSSDLKKDNSLHAQDKVLHICELLGATEYYNAIGGQELYSFDAFDSKKINLKFLKTDEIAYKQFKNDFCPNLSIIDVLMFNSVEAVKGFLDSYSLIER